MPRTKCDDTLISATKSDLTGQDSSSTAAARHLENCADCREAVARKVAIQNLIERTEMDPIAERRLAVKVLSAHKRDSWKPVRALMPRVVLIGCAVAGAIAAAVWISFGFLERSGREAPTKDAFVALISHEEAVPRIDIPASLQPVKRIDAIREPKTILMAQGTKVWVKKNTEVSVISDTPKLARTRVDRGRIIVDIPHKRHGFRFVVHTPAAEVESLGTLFSVEVREDGGETIRVVKSAVVVRPVGGTESVVVRAGEELSLGAAMPTTAETVDLETDLCLVRGACHLDEEQDTSSDIEAEEMGKAIPEPPLSKAVRNSAHKGVAERHSLEDRIDEAIASGQLDVAEQFIKQWTPTDGNAKLKRLIHLANGYRNKHMFKQAVGVYELIFSAYPNSDAAINGLVSMGQIKQGMLGDAAGAAFYFERYLKKRPRGSLAEAASAGRVRALFTLKQWEDVMEASRQYMQLHPRGLSREEVLQKRRTALERLGKK